jgi:hypothetical protein
MWKRYRRPVAFMVALTAVALLASALVPRFGAARDASGPEPRRPAPVPRTWYAAPDGDRGAPGTLDEPWNLATALSSTSPALPGDTIWLRGGIYEGSFTSELVGAPDHPIVVRQYDGERATLDGATSSKPTLTIRGQDTWYWGFEVTNSSPTRVFSTAADPNGRRPTGIDVFGPRTRLINLIVHDASNGIGLWEHALDAEVYGTLTYHNGLIDPSRGHGHGIYSQNETGTKRIRDVISFGNHATGMKAYAEQGHAIGQRIEGVISFGNGWQTITDAMHKAENMFVGTVDNPADDVTIADNALYHEPGVLAPNLALGYDNKTNGRIVVANNYIAGGSTALALLYWKSAEVRGNVIYAVSSGNDNADQILATVQTSQGWFDRLSRLVRPDSYQWDQNHYFDGTDLHAPFMFDAATNPHGGAKLEFAQWRGQTGFDAHSDFANGRPAGRAVIVRPNAYERGRAHVAVYNWARDPAVPVPLDSIGLRPGDAFEVRDAQNFFGPPLMTATYDGRPVEVPMTGRAVAPFVGSTAFSATHTPIEFGAFVVLPVHAPER